MLLGAFIASAIPLGIDQVTSGSNTNISAFVTWLGWASFCGFSIPGITGSVFYNCTHLMESEVRMIMSLLPVLLLSVGLILDFHFHHKLVKEPVTVNPVSHIFKVLKYAAKHKYPVQRSAFTYCENERPTRLDYGKSKYGGPFTTEQVEDVKTFWRVVVVIMVLSTFALPFMQQSESGSNIEMNLSKSNCIQAVSKAAFAPSVTIVYYIPLYELLIYPCLRNRGPSILQSAGIGAAALIASSLYGIAYTAIETFTDATTECMFTQTNESKISVIPFNHILGFTALVLYKSSLEFVCAQAPYNMKGLLIGLFINFETLFFTLGAVLYEVWKNNWFDILHTSTCGIWFYLSTLVLAVVSSALLGLVIRWYKARERDETLRSQTLVEEVYHKYQQQNVSIQEEV
jgi:peptide/histidine transporter 3/4